MHICSPIFTLGGVRLSTHVISGVKKKSHGDRRGNPFISGINRSGKATFRFASKSATEAHANPLSFLPTHLYASSEYLFPSAEPLCRPRGSRTSAESTALTYGVWTTEVVSQISIKCLSKALSNPQIRKVFAQKFWPQNLTKRASYWQR